MGEIRHKILFLPGRTGQRLHLFLHGSRHPVKVFRQLSDLIPARNGEALLIVALSHAPCRTGHTLQGRRQESGQEPQQRHASRNGGKIAAQKILLQNFLLLHGLAHIPLGHEVNPVSCRRNVLAFVCRFAASPVLFRRAVYIGFHPIPCQARQA